MFLEFLENNRETLYEIANNNTPKDKNGTIVIPVGDEWRDEFEWEE